MTPLAEGTMLRTAPLAPRVALDELVAQGVLVLVPHPDDETLGCGGALAAAATAGRDVHVVVITDGAGSHPGSTAWPRSRLGARRARELGNALGALGNGRLTFDMLGRPDQGGTMPCSPGMPSRLSLLTDLMIRRGLRTLWTTWEGDPHPDHVDAARLADALQQRYAARSGQPATLLRFPVWGRFIEANVDRTVEELVRFEPDAVSRDAKRRALACHATQMTPLIDDDPHGFVMPPAMQRHFIEHDELFIRRRASRIPSCSVPHSTSN